MYNKAVAVAHNLANKSMLQMLQEIHSHIDRVILDKMLLEWFLFHQVDRVVCGDLKTLDEIVSSIQDGEYARKFLAIYVEEVKEVVAGKANCGCWYSAEEGRACEHDLALLAPVPAA